MKTNYIDFFIVGAPKCGTTAFDVYLSQHPDIAMLPKELHYWGKDLCYRELNPNLENNYKNAIKKAERTNKKLIGEGAVWYLISKEAPKELKTHNENAKILIFLRNPTEAIYSLYSNMVFNGNETAITFEEALNLQDERQAKLPNFYNCPTIAFQYQQIYSYYEQVKRYFNVFGKENVKVVVFEEFLKDKQATYNEVLRFLELPPHSINFEQINANKKIRFKRLRQFILQPNPKVKAFFKFIFPSKPLREKIKAFLWQINSKETKRPPMKEQTKSYLKNYFKQDIENLETHLDKDLSIWK